MVAEAGFEPSALLRYQKKLSCAEAHSIFLTAATPYCSLYLPLAALANVPFGLSLRAGRRRVSHTAASQAQLCLLALWATPLTKNSPQDCFRLANPTSHARRSHNPLYKNNQIQAQKNQPLRLVGGCGGWI